MAFKRNSDFQNEDWKLSRLIKFNSEEITIGQFAQFTKFSSLVNFFLFKCIRIHLTLDRLLDTC